MRTLFFCSFYSLAEISSYPETDLNPEHEFPGGKLGQWREITLKENKKNNILCICSTNVIVTFALPRTHAFRPRHWLGDPTYRYIDSPAASKR